jgi:hypothetical protein
MFTTFRNPQSNRAHRPEEFSGFEPFTEDMKGVGREGPVEFLHDRG